MEPDKKEVARAIAKALRHEPESLGIELDTEGWVSIEDLLLGFDSHTPFMLEMHEIEDALLEANYGRFEYDEATGMVRALKGHTTDHVSYDAVEPVGDLYRAIPARHANYIERHGFRPTKRKYTQFFLTFDAAVKDGKTRGIEEVCLIAVNSREAYHDGTVFYLHDGDWYLKRIDAMHIEVLDM